MRLKRLLRSLFKCGFKIQKMCQCKTFIFQKIYRYLYENVHFLTQSRQCDKLILLIIRIEEK